MTTRAEETVDLVCDVEECDADACATVGSIDTCPRHLFVATLEAVKAAGPGGEFSVGAPEETIVLVRGVVAGIVEELARRALGG